MTPANYAPTDGQPWQSIVDTLERAAAVCHARGGRADLALEDQVSWLGHCLTIEHAAYAVRAALPFELADTIPDIPGGLTAGASATTDRPASRPPAPAAAPVAPDASTQSAENVPLALLERAHEDLDRLQDNPFWLGNVPMLLASFEVAEALTTVRAHYE